MRRPCSRPSCLRIAGPSASALLVHEIVMLVTPQAGIDRTSGEWPSPGTFARLAARDGRLQPPPRLVIVEDFRPALQRDLTNDLCHGFEILEGIQRQHAITPSHEGRWSAAVLRRAGATAADAGGICLSRFRLQPVLDTNLVAP